MSFVEVPGKVLLLGEYSVLAGGPALPAAVPVRFRYSTTVEKGAGLRIDRDSPAGRLALLAPVAGPVIDQADPAGLVLGFERTVEGGSPLGLGSSTADFIAVHASMRPEADWQEAWRTYRELHSGEQVPPSGADLVAQWNGGVGVFRMGRNGAEQAEWRTLAGDYANAPVVLLQASHQMGRKTPTHEHLARIVSILPTFVELGKIAERGIAAFERQDWESFAESVREASAWLESRGLEHSRTTDDRQSLEALPGVRAVKGCGAMLSDSLVVVTDGSAEADARVRSTAASRNLRVLQSGLPRAPGRTLG